MLLHTRTEYNFTVKQLTTSAAPDCKLIKN